MYIRPVKTQPPSTVQNWYHTKAPHNTNTCDKKKVAQLSPPNRRQGGGVAGHGVDVCGEGALASGGVNRPGTLLLLYTYAGAAVIYRRTLFPGRLSSFPPWAGDIRNRRWMERKSLRSCTLYNTYRGFFFSYLYSFTNRVIFVRHSTRPDRTAWILV